MNIIKNIVLIIAMMALMVGGMIYVFFRPESIMMFKWFPFLGVLRKQVSFFHNVHFPDYIVYSIPDGLWLLSYILLMGAIWNFKYQRCLFIIILLPIFAIFHEIFQLYHLVPGYFDVLDLVVYVIATITGLSILVLSNYMYEYKKQTL